MRLLLLLLLLAFAYPLTLASYEYSIYAETLFLLRGRPDAPSYPPSLPAIAVPHHLLPGLVTP